MRLFDEGTSWEQARKDTRYPSARLDARKHHATLSSPLRSLLAQWVTIDQERRDADDAVVDANALVSAVDEDLDAAVNDLVSRLLYEVGNNAASAIFKAYFPEAPNEVLRLGLESEIARTRKLLPIAKEKKASPEVMAILEEIAAIEEHGTQALAARVEAYAKVSRVALRIPDLEGERERGPARCPGGARDLRHRQREAPRLPGVVLPGSSAGEEGQGGADELRGRRRGALGAPLRSRPRMVPSGYPEAPSSVDSSRAGAERRKRAGEERHHRRQRRRLAHPGEQSRASRPDADASRAAYGPAGQRRAVAAASAAAPDAARAHAFAHGADEPAGEAHRRAGAPAHGPAAAPRRHRARHRDLDDCGRAARADDAARARADDDRARVAAAERHRFAAAGRVAFLADRGAGHGHVSIAGRGRASRGAHVRFAGRASHGAHVRFAGAGRGHHGHVRFALRHGHVAGDGPQAVFTRDGRGEAARAGARRGAGASRGIDERGPDDPRRQPG